MHYQSNFQHFTHRFKRLWRRSRLILFIWVAWPAPADAFQGLPPTPETIWSAWNLEPSILAILIVIAWGYFRGVRRLWRRAGLGRGIHVWQAVAFSAGLLVLLAALVSPLGALGTALFSVHMLQHLLLMIVAAPLLVLGAPLLPLIWALPKPARQALGRWWRKANLVRSLWQNLSQPLLVWLLYGFTLWIWHLPALYQAALEQVVIHELEHITFFGTALLFWWVLIQPIGHRRMNYGAGVLFIFTTALHSGALGALLTFAQRPLYPIYVARAWNTTALEDQQLAGLIMWIPMGVIYLITALVLLALWLQTTEQRVRRREAAYQLSADNDPIRYY